MSDQRTRQSLAALAHANEIRYARAKLKRKLAAKEIDAASILRNPPPEAASMRVGELLEAQWCWGTKRTMDLLRSLDIHPHRPLLASSQYKAYLPLSERQRLVLAQALA